MIEVIETNVLGRRTVSIRKCVFVSIFFALFPQSGMAVNGINIIGFGAESSGMGGADLAVARDSSALNTNPAGLHQIENSQLDIYAAHATSTETRHTDSFGNNIQADIGGSFIEFGYAGKPGMKKLTWGFGVFVQGGIGAKYNNMRTAFGTQDKLQTEMAIIRFTPGFSWQYTQETVFGVSALLTYARGEQQFFPDTSFLGATPEQSFFGFAINDTHSFSPALKLGLMHKLNEVTTLGITYTSETHLTLDNGDAIIDFSALGLGKVNYRKASMGGLDLPQEFGIGISHQLGNKWLLAADISWLNWSQSAKKYFIRASNPDNPSAPATISHTLPLNWNNQTVLAAGVEYKASSDSAIRFGINVANNPVPNNRETPFLAAIATKHITAGYMRIVNRGWRLSTAIEYQLPEKSTYTNSDQPFGPDAGIELDSLIVHIMLSHQW